MKNINGTYILPVLVAVLIVTAFFGVNYHIFGTSFSGFHLSQALSVEEPEKLVEDPEISLDENINLSETQQIENMEAVEISEGELVEENEEGVNIDDEKEVEVSEEEEKPSSVLPAPGIKAGPDGLRIGFLTDSHIRSKPVGSGRRIGDEYRQGLDYFVRQMNNVFMPNFIVMNGDIIEGSQRPASTGIAELSQCRDILNKTTIKKYWVTGNHDLRSVTKAQWKQTLGINYTNTAFDAGNYRIIILDGNYYHKDESDIRPGKYFTAGMVSKAEKKWLKDELKKSKKKKIVFIHQPLLTSGTRLLKDADDLREMFSDNDVLAVFSGHTEGLFHKKDDGVHYYIIPGMTKNESYQGNFAEIDIMKDKISVTLNYKSKGGYKTKQVK